MFQALARALYAQASIIVLDDALSSVDRATSASIADNLFGSGGLLRTRSCTVVMVTNSRSCINICSVLTQR